RRLTTQAFGRPRNSRSPSSMRSSRPLFSKWQRVHAVAGGAAGNPPAVLKRSGEGHGCSWVHYAADLSRLGLPADVPLIASSFEGDSCIEWHLGPIPICQTNEGAPPSWAAERLDGNTRVKGYSRFVRAESMLAAAAPREAEKRGAVFVEL